MNDPNGVIVYGPAAWLVKGGYIRLEDVVSDEEVERAKERVRKRLNEKGVPV